MSSSLLCAVLPGVGLAHRARQGRGPCPSATSQNDHTAMHADDLYELISDRASDGKPLIRTSNGAPRDGTYLFANHVVAEFAKTY